MQGYKTRKLRLTQLGFDNKFLSVTPEAWSVLGKLMCTLLKLKFYPIKDNGKKMKGQTTKWEKIFANPISNKIVLSRIEKECKI